ncbi:MAG: bifunctional riboflavin kinase/FAD synthetase [Anaerovoracaceae bacterium]|jgi:riboflavin kinase/FMN adenylyltransferase
MKIFKTLEELKNTENVAVAVGNFDGVHLGHQELIRRTVTRAKEVGLVPAVFTFTNHPKNVMAGEQRVKNILYWEDKVSILQDLGVEYMISLDFTLDFSRIEPEDFVEEILVNKLKTKEIFCGFNYHFGYKGKGDLQLLKEMSRDLDFVVNPMEPFKINGELVSSTLIREIIASGDMEKCRHFLGRNYSTSGTVIVGNKLGRSLGYPTSNLAIDESMVTPPDGVYVTLASYGGTSCPSITNLGRKPTVGNHERSIETHIFNFNKELYGKQIRIEFLKRLRGEKKFESVEELSDQIRKDCLDAAHYHGMDIKSGKECM